MAVESQLGEGAAFTVRMPVLVDEAARIALSAQTAARLAHARAAQAAARDEPEAQDESDGFISPSASS
jgi:hypothetical protein